MVKNEKSIVDMLIVDMRNWEKYTNAHKISFHTSKQVQEELLQALESVLGELPARNTAFRSPSPIYQVI